MVAFKFRNVLLFILAVACVVAVFHFYFGRPVNRYIEVIRVVPKNIYPMDSLQTRESLESRKSLRPDDFHTLVNLTNFDYLITKPPVKMIKDANNVTLPDFVILIHTNPYHTALRRSIRETWSQADPRALTYFMLGAVNTKQKQAEIEAEDLEHNDIIQGNFFDSYHNLTYKHAMCLKWFKDNCSGMKYLIKLDDDVYTNVPSVYEFLQKNKYETNFLMGLYRAPELAKRAGKWMVSEDERQEDWYPSYVWGNMIIYSSDLVTALYELTKVIPFFWIDDVYITGVCRSRLNNKIVPIYDYLLTDEDKVSDAFARPDFMFSKHSTTPKYMVKIWNKTTDYRDAHRYVAPDNDTVEHSVY